MLPIVFNMVPGAGTSLDRIGELMEYSETGIPDRPAVGPEAGTFSLSSDPIVSLEHHPNNIMVKDGELIMIDLGDFWQQLPRRPIWWSYRRNMLRFIQI